MQNLKKFFLLLFLFNLIILGCKPENDRLEIKNSDRYISKEVVRDIKIEKHVMEVRNFHRIHQKINKAVFEGRLTPYMDATLQNSYTKEDLEFRITSEELIRLPDQENPEISRDTIIKHRHDMSNIKMYRVMEHWLYDIKDYRYEGKLIAIAPIFKPVYEGVELGSASVYWLSIKELEQFLKSGDMENLSYYLFESFYTSMDAYGSE